MEYRDYYSVLGVPRTASQAEIKKAFRRLAREYHPDRRPGDKSAEQRFKDVNEAHEVLSDPGKRGRYDALGANWEAFSRSGGGDPFGPGGPFAGYAPGGAAGRGGIRFEFASAGDPSGFSDFFRTFFTGGGAPGGRAGASGPRRGSIEDLLAGMGIADEVPPGIGRRTGGRPVEAEAELSLEEAYRGAARIVEVGGKRLEVQIPRGVSTGSRVKLSGQGGGGRDLIVITRVRPHPVFTRRGTDLEREVLVTLEEALLGAEVPVPTLKGRVLLTVPPGTQSGRTFRLARLGMPHLNATGSGDLYVRVRVVLPSALSEGAREAARRFFDLIDQPDPRTAG